MQSSSSSTPQAFRLRYARSFHLLAHTFLIALQTPSTVAMPP